MQAKKSFGQHFITDSSVCERIADLCPAGPDEHVLEIGPGRGALTIFIKELYPDAKYVEADLRLKQHLESTFPKLKERIIWNDFLKLSLSDVFSEELHLVGNFPYNISSQIVFKMLENKGQVVSLTGMFQKEVAERIIAKPGSKTYGVISVLTQLFYEGSYAFSIPPEAFDPPPKVMSGVICLTRKAKLELECDYGLLKHIVKTAFQQRRKMLRNSIKGLIKDIDQTNIEPYLNLRPEQLSGRDFIFLTQNIYLKQ